MAPDNGSAADEHIDILPPDEDDDDTFSLYMPTGQVPGDAGVEAADHTPNGYFWESLLAWLISTLAPELEDTYEPDSEAGTFVVYTDTREAAERLRSLIHPYVADAALVQAAIGQAEAAGFEFDD